ncbi:MAG: hypothetical protein AABZ60_24385 [Planctomycetota bacterium]
MKWISFVLFFSFVSVAQKQEFSHPYFPLVIGNFWEFIDNHERSIVFKISHKDESGQFRMINYKKPDEIGDWKSLKIQCTEGFLILYEPDTSVVEEENSSESYLQDQILSTQIAVGTTWEYRPSAELNLRNGKIVGKESQTVPAGTFSDCLKVELIREEMVLSLWFAKNVGWVRILFSDPKDETRNVEWTLSKYRVVRHAETNQYETPQAVFSSFQNHLASKTFSQAYQCLSKIDQEKTPFQEFTEKMQNSPMLEKIIQSTLENVDIQQNIAQAVMKMDEENVPILFIKEEQSWKIKN